MLGGGCGPVEPRLRSVPAAGAAAKVAKLAHLAAALAVHTAAPPRPRSQYFARNRSGFSTLSHRRGLGLRRGKREADDDDDEGKEEGKEVDDEESVRGPAARRGSEDSTSSVSRSITSSGMSSDYTTEDENSEYITDDDDQDVEEDGEEEEEQEGNRLLTNFTAPKASASGLGPSELGRHSAGPPPRIGAVATALEAVAAARARLRQRSHISSTAATAAAASPSIGASPVTGGGAEPPRLPPVVPRKRGPGEPASPSAAIPASATVGMAIATAGTGGLSGLRLLLAAAAAPPPQPPPAAAPASPLAQPLASASRRSSMLATSPSGKGFASVVSAASTTPSPGGAIPGDVNGTATAGGSSDKSESLAEWVAHRFRTSSRRDVQAMPTEAVAPIQLPRSLPGSGGSAGGEACGGLRGLLATRTDGAASWYARTTRWHDPLSPAGALHTTVLDLRQSPHGSAASHVLGAPVSLAPLELQRKVDGSSREAT